LSHGIQLIRDEIDGALGHGKPFSDELLVGQTRSAVTQYLSNLVRDDFDGGLNSRERLALEMAETRDPNETDPVLILACRLMDLYDAAVNDPAQWKLFHAHLNEFEEQLI
jgi:hypothetical protein